MTGGKTANEQSGADCDTHRLVKVPPLAGFWTALHAVNEMAFHMPFEGSVSTNSV